jgi:hypothetical protein
MRVSVLNRGARLDGRGWLGSGDCMLLRLVRADPPLL